MLLDRHLHNHALNPHALNMEKCPPNSSLLKLMNLNLSRHQCENSDVIWLIILHTHGISRLTLLGFLLATVVNNILDVKLVLLHSLLLLFYHLVSDFN